MPVSWVIRTTEAYETAEAELTPTQNYCERISEEYLLSQLIAGRILRSDVTFDSGENCVALSGHYLCSEMIGRTKIEQSVQGETKSD